MNDSKYIEVGKAYLAYLKALNRAESSNTELSEAIENIRSDSLYTFSEDDVDHLEDTFEVFLKNAEEVKKVSKDLGETLEILLSKKEPSLKTLCELYTKDPDACKRRYPGWFLIIEKVGVEVCKSYGYKKIDIRRLYEASVHISNENLVHRVQSIFRVGKWYRGSYIKDTLTELGIDKPKATTLRKWFEIERVPNKGVSGYRIIRKL